MLCPHTSFIRHPSLSHVAICPYPCNPIQAFLSLFSSPEHSPPPSPHTHRRFCIQYIPTQSPRETRPARHGVARFTHSPRQVTPVPKFKLLPSWKRAYRARPSTEATSFYHATLPLGGCLRFWRCKSTARKGEGGYCTPLVQGKQASKCKFINAQFVFYKPKSKPKPSKPPPRAP